MKKLCLLLALLLMLNLCGCRYIRDILSDDDRTSVSDRDDDGEDDDDDDRRKAEDPEKVLKNTLKALTGDEEAGGYVLGADGTAVAPSNTGIAKLLSTYVTFDVESFEEHDETAEATVTITAPDTPALLKAAMEEMDGTDEEELTRCLEELLEDEPAMVTNTVEVQMVLADDTWCVVPDFALSNALTGGLTEAYIQLQQQIVNGLMEGGDGE